MRHSLWLAVIAISALAGADDLVAGARRDAVRRLQSLEAGSNRALLPGWFALGPSNVGGRGLSFAVDPSDGKPAPRERLSVHLGGRNSRPSAAIESFRMGG